jgi:hypothetical protein
VITQKTKITRNDAGELSGNFNPKWAVKSAGATLSTTIREFFFFFLVASFCRVFSFEFIALAAGRRRRRRRRRASVNIVSSLISLPVCSCLWLCTVYYFFRILAVCVSVMSLRISVPFPFFF